MKVYFLLGLSVLLIPLLGCKRSEEGLSATYTKTIEYPHSDRTPFESVIEVKSRGERFVSIEKWGEHQKTIEYDGVGHLLVIEDGKQSISHSTTGEMEAVRFWKKNLGEDAKKATRIKMLGRKLKYATLSNPNEFYQDETGLIYNAQEDFEIWVDSKSDVVLKMIKKRSKTDDKALLEKIIYTATSIDYSMPAQSYFRSRPEE